jgi:Ribbon-helix-helix protein, copG family
MSTLKPKPRKAGRPPLPKGSTKAAMLRIRVTADELRAIESAAKANRQTRSEFIRSKLLTIERA